MNDKFKYTIEDIKSFTIIKASETTKNFAFSTSNKDTQRAHARLEILPNATDPLISDNSKYVAAPWATVPTPKIDPSSWDDATIETVNLKELTATAAFMNRIKISKQIDADEQKGNATIVELAGRKIIIDGHERLMALWLLGLDEAPVWIVKE